MVHHKRSWENIHRSAVICYEVEALEAVQLANYVIAWEQQLPNQNVGVSKNLTEHKYSITSPCNVCAPEPELLLTKTRVSFSLLN